MQVENNDQIYTDIKLIIKELLFSGADRHLRTNDDLTAFEIAQGHKDSFSDEQNRSL